MDTGFTVQIAEYAASMLGLLPWDSFSAPGIYQVAPDSSALPEERMKSYSSLMACPIALALLFGMGLVAQVAIAQSTPSNDGSATPAIAYSEMQAPMPTPAGQAAPDPIPPTQQQQPEDRPAPGRPGKSEPESQTATTPAQQDAVRTLTGTVIKNGAQFVLSTTDNTNYQLDDQERASRYQDKQVKVTGTVDATTRKVHVQNIEPIV